ncbi:hypothetical protein ACQKIE_00200 [Luteibacter sp. NPDC031894]|uniref:hypothetical protein n=1 Tax=Luteibacter sp. NPDC031894 TaxID=3390572 RepID=UPI003D0054FE
MASSGWAKFGSALGGDEASQLAAYDKGATGVARLEGLLSEARLKRDKETGLAGINSDSVSAALSDPAQAPALLAAMFHGDVDPRQLSGYQKDSLDTTIKQDAYGRVQNHASVADVNPLLAVLQGKPVEISKVQGDVAFNPYATTDQNTFDPTQVGLAEIMKQGAQADASRASAANSYASAAKTRGEIADANSPATGGGKASDWVVQTDAAGNIWRINKKTGASSQVVAPGGAPIQNKQAFAAQQATQQAEGTEQSFNTALDTLKDLQSAKGLDAAVGFSSLLPTRPGSDAADFEAKLDSFKAQTFLPMVQNLRGLGALSDAEGSKLSAAVGSLSTKQSEDQFKSSLKTIRTTLMAAQERARKNTQSVGNIAAGRPASQPATTPQAAPVQAPRASPPTPLRAVNPATGHAVVWNGTAWVDE